MVLNKLNFILEIKFYFVYLYIKIINYETEKRTTRRDSKS